MKREGEELEGKLAGVTIGADGKPFLAEGAITSASIDRRGFPGAIFRRSLESYAVSKLDRRC